MTEFDTCDNAPASVEPAVMSRKSREYPSEEARERHLAYMRNYMRENRPRLREYARKYYAAKNPRGPRIERSADERRLLRIAAVRRCQQERPLTLPAHRAVMAAIKRRELSPPEVHRCRDCGGPATEYDHRDYTKPLEVDPVCHSCNVRRGPGYPYNKESPETPRGNYPCPPASRRAVSAGP